MLVRKGLGAVTAYSVRVLSKADYPAHLRVAIFVGPDPHHLQQAGVIIMHESEVTDLARRLGDNADNRPHSRACGWKEHPHGTECSADCPTCRGQ